MIEKMGFGELRSPNPIFSALLIFRALGESMRIFDNQDFSNTLITDSIQLDSSLYFLYYVDTGFFLYKCELLEKQQKFILVPRSGKPSTNLGGGFIDRLHYCRR